VERPLGPDEARTSTALYEEFPKKSVVRDGRLDTVHYHRGRHVLNSLVQTVK